MLTLNPKQPIYSPYREQIIQSLWLITRTTYGLYNYIAHLLCNVAYDLYRVKLLAYGLYRAQLLAIMT